MHVHFPGPRMVDVPVVDLARLVPVVLIGDGAFMTNPNAMEDREVRTGHAHHPLNAHLGLLAAVGAIVATKSSQPTDAMFLRLPIKHKSLHLYNSCHYPLNI